MSLPRQDVGFRTANRARFGQRALLGRSLTTLSATSLLVLVAASCGGGDDSPATDPNVDTVAGMAGAADVDPGLGNGGTTGNSGTTAGSAAMAASGAGNAANNEMGGSAPTAGGDGAAGNAPAPIGGTNGIEPNEPGGAAGAGNANGVAGASGASGAGGSGEIVTCSVNTCPPPSSQCVVAVCNGNGQCAEQAVPDAVAAQQTAGDCKVKSCVAGKVVQTTDDADAPQGASECKVGKCTAGTPSQSPQTPNAPCGNLGTNFCNEDGQCVQCNAAAQCPGQDTECHSRTCNNGSCGFNNVGPGTPAGPQTQGDCKKNQCDGAGSLMAVADPNDILNDNNPCTDNSCNGATPVATPSAPQTPCGGGMKCDGAAHCVSCLAPADCPTPANTCLTATCGNGACGTTPKGNGTACTQGANAGTCQGGACTVCGNGVTEAGEQCDDNNKTPCDGCSPKCQLDTAVTYGTPAGLGLAITDDGYLGTLASMVCVNVTVTASGDNVVDYVCPTLGVAHTWLGDLTIKLVSPSNTVVTLMSLPGVIEAADDGSNAPGDSSNLSAAFPVTWKDGGPKSAELMGDSIVNSGIVCRDDLACVYDPNNGAAAAGKLAAFIGQAGPGTWKLCVGDSGMGDVGTIDRVQLVIGQ